MSGNELVGEVRGFRQWTETKNDPFTDKDIQIQVWTFQLERRQDGERLPPIPVELRGESISGVLNEGNIVRLDINTWQTGQTVMTDRVFNVTLNTPVVATHRGIPWWRIAVAVVMVLAFLAFVVWGFRQVGAW